MQQKLSRITWFIVLKQVVIFFSFVFSYTLYIYILTQFRECVTAHQSTIGKTEITISIYQDNCVIIVGNNDYLAILHRWIVYYLN